MLREGVEVHPFDSLALMYNISLHILNPLEKDANIFKITELILQRIIYIPGFPTIGIQGRKFYLNIKNLVFE